jgi:hypothetical protein
MLYVFGLLGVGTYDLEENITSREGLSFLLLPRRDPTFRHGGRHGWHFKVRDGMASTRPMQH